MYSLELISCSLAFYTRGYQEPVNALRRVFSANTVEAVLETTLRREHYYTT